MASKFATPEARRAVLAGYPMQQKIDSPEALETYFSGNKITCLRCGKKYRTLGLHLKTIHQMEPDEYRGIYGIPWTYGLSCSETTKLHSDDALQKIADGTFDATGKFLHLARAVKHKPRQAVRDVLSARNLEKMNAGKDGSVVARRKLMPKRGTPEHADNMRARPQTEKAKEWMPTFWVGKEQTDEHVFNRTGYHKKNK